MDLGLRVFKTSFKLQQQEVNVVNNTSPSFGYEFKLSFLDRKPGLCRF